MSVRCDVLAIGTELLLGQIVDTNSAWIGEQLAANGIDCLFQAKVGDNHARIVDELRPRSPGPTPSSCAAASGPPTTTSPGRPSPRSWAASWCSTRRWPT